MIAADNVRYKVINDWKKYDSNIQSREDATIAERDAYQVLNYAEWAIQKTSEAISQ